MRYAASTEVDVGRSRNEIERVLARYGAEQFMFGWNERGSIVEFIDHGRRVRFLLPLPSLDEFRSTTGGRTQNTGSSQGSNSNGLLSGSSSTNSSSGMSQQLSGRALLTPDEVMRLPSDALLAILDGENPYMLRRPNYLRDLEYAGTFDGNPYHAAAPAPAIGERP